MKYKDLSNDGIFDTKLKEDVCPFVVLENIHGFKCGECMYNNHCYITTRIRHLNEYHFSKQYITRLENEYGLENVIKMVEESDRLHGC